jgi:hypothetical protein
MVKTKCRSLASLGMTMGLGMTAVALAGCDLGSSTIPQTDPLIVVHAVLNPSLIQQVILLEESRTGKKPPIAADPNNLIVGSGGIPIVGASVQLEDETGAIYNAAEARAGIYVVGIAAQPGRRYQLKVQALGKTVTASTVVPRGVIAGAAPLVPFNRDRDTAKVSLPEVEFARGYFLRIDAPISAFSVVTSDREISITGDTRNLFTENLLRVFFPGFEQTLTVAAVDTNLYDYYRSRSDPFSGIGLINRVQGGLGVFGSIAVIERRILDVTQDFSGHPLEDTFTRRDPAPDSVPRAVHFYRESSAKTPDSQDRVSGYYISGPVNEPIRGPLLFSVSQVGTLDVQMFKPHTTADVVGAFIVDPVLYDDGLPQCCKPPDTLRVYFDGVPGVLKYVRQGK